jgi:hypothetical protein
MAGLELKHAEIDTLNKEHTAKMQAKEVFFLLTPVLNCIVNF